MNRARGLQQLSVCLQGRLPANPAWDDVLALANETLVSGELYPVIVQQGTAAPAELQHFLAEVHRRTLLRNQGLTETLQEAACLLNEIGIEPILLKGCATWVQGDSVEAPPLRARLTADLDLLLPIDAFEKAITHFLAHGYRVLEDARRHTHHPVMVLGRKGDVGSLDLHSRPPGWRPALGLDLDEMSRRVTCGEAWVKALPPDLLILVLVTHDQVLDARFWRGGFDLRHLLDMREIVSQQSVNWERLETLASAAELKKELGAQLWAAHTIVGAAIPNDKLRRCGGWGRYQRHRLQFLWPQLNQLPSRLGLRRLLWRTLAARRFPTAPHLD